MVKFKARYDVYDVPCLFLFTTCLPNYDGNKELFPFVFSVVGECHKFQKVQPQVPSTQQPSLLDLPGVADHAPST